MLLRRYQLRRSPPYVFFFFSSRRRHTRLQGDWSSDVCSSDLIGVARRVAVVDVGEDAPPPLVLINPRIVPASDVLETAEEGCLSIPDVYGDVEQIGRASCRERV